MSSELAVQQQTLLQALRLDRHDDASRYLLAHGCLSPTAVDGQWQRGLKAYRSNAIELAQRALTGAYPVVAQLLGEENFAALAAALWRVAPPIRGDVALWGDGLPAHIDSLADLREAEPYLADVARVEWALHRAATAADAGPDAASFRLLTEADPAEFRLVPGPGVTCIASDYPVVSITHAHLDGEPTLDEAGRRLRAGVAEIAVVWRHGLKPSLREARPGEARFIDALKGHRSLADSLDAAPDLDFNNWLAPAVQGGLITGAALLPRTTPGETS